MQNDFIRLFFAAAFNYFEKLLRLFAADDFTEEKSDLSTPFFLFFATRNNREEEKRETKEKERKEAKEKIKKITENKEERETSLPLSPQKNENPEEVFKANSSDKKSPQSIFKEKLSGDPYSFSGRERTHKPARRFT